MKLKKVQSKKLCLSIATLAVLGSSNLGAVSISDTSSFSSNFTQTQTGTGEYSYNGTDTTIDFASDSSFEDSGAKKFVISADKGVTALTLGSGTAPSSGDYGSFCLGCNGEEFDLNAQDITIKKYAEFFVQNNANITGNVTINNGAFNANEDQRSNGIISIVDGFGGYAGRLNITGNLTTNNAVIWYNDESLRGGLIKVSGDVNIQNSAFGLSFRDVNNFTANNYELIRTDTKFNNDILTSNEVVGLLIAFPSLIPNIDSRLENLMGAGLTHLNDLGFTQYTLSLSSDGKSLLANGGATDKVKDLNALFELKKEMYQSLLDRLDIAEKEVASDPELSGLQSKITEARQQATELMNKLDTTQNPNNANSSSVLIETMANISQDERALASTLFDSLGSSALSNDIVSKVILASIADNGATLKRVVDDLNSNATSQANANSASSSVSSTMNLSNDMAIGSRLASLNNPFANLAYAKKLSKA
ncbi:hypothetical protein CQA38_09105, partial [Campylobacter sp. MIT 12-5580]|uniref:hypothetical protein n=1 Tax=Campylobacter sp. MIT 12-5580 TaxID=2040651 RepID=UPI0010F5C1C0